MSHSGGMSMLSCQCSVCCCCQLEQPGWLPLTSSVVSDWWQSNQNLAQTFSPLYLPESISAAQSTITVQNGKSNWNDFRVYIHTWGIMNHFIIHDIQSFCCQGDSIQGCFQIYNIWPWFHCFWCFFLIAHLTVTRLKVFLSSCWSMLVLIN